MSLELANLLFPQVTKSVQDLANQYPTREGVVTRFAPSPTGFLHIGGVYTALVAERFAHQNGGQFLLRIEDTDQKRLIPGTILLIINALNKKFDLQIDEGPTDESGKGAFGEYGPYIQSMRIDLYHVFARELVLRGLAYPCFMTQEELLEIRESQEKQKIIPGIYGEYSKYANADIGLIRSKIEAGEKFVLRFKSHGQTNKRVNVSDLIKGEIQTNDNFNDIVLLKSDGIPTYHLAHIVDDFLMGVTHVIRSDEWFASLPLHTQLWNAFDIQSPKYAHISPLAKIDNGNKRKLSKRKDPEADVEYYFTQGYSAQAIIDYLMNIIDSSYEEWKNNNPTKTYKDFSISLEKMNPSWAMVDVQKLEFVSTEYISSLDIDTFYDMALSWADNYNQDLADYMSLHPDYTKAALNIERGTPNDPKRFHKFSDIASQLMFFYDEEYEFLADKLPQIPSDMPIEIVKEFLYDYANNLDLDVDKDTWFANLKELATKHMFAINNAQFKQGGYIGKIGDAAMILRIVLCASKTTPDLYETQCVMGKQRVINRINMFLEK